MAKVKTKWVSLIPGDPTTFRRAVRNAEGEVVDVLRFLPDVPLELEAEQLELVKHDIGRVLCFVDRLENLPEDRYRVDWASTEQHHETIHGTKVARPVSKSVHVGASSQPDAVVGDDEPSNTEASENDEDDEELIDIRALLAAGIDADIAEFLGLNSAEEGMEWLLDPAAIKTKVAEGFDLTKLTDIGRGRAGVIKQSLGIAEGK